MGGSLWNSRTISAAVLAVVFIGGAYYLARGTVTPPTAEASTETALLQAIATKDTDHDGLPDWEESLYGTDPTNPDTFHLGMTDGEAVARGLIVPKAIADASVATSSGATTGAADGVPAPAPEGTLTDAFAKNFFTLYLSTKEQNNGQALTQDQMSAVADQALAQLSESVAPAPDFKSRQDLTVSGSGADALKAYAAEAEAVFAAQGVTLPKSELAYLQDALNGDESAYANLDKLAGAYRRVAAGLSALAVPQELADTELALINGMARMGGSVADFERVKTDPMTAMLALEQYPKAVLAVAQALRDVQRIYAQNGASLSAGTPGAFFVNAADSIGASTSTKP